MQKNILYITHRHTHTRPGGSCDRGNTVAVWRGWVMKLCSRNLIVLLFFYISFVAIATTIHHNRKSCDICLCSSVSLNDLWCLMFIHTNTLLTPPPPADAIPFQVNLNTWMSLPFRMNPAVPLSGQRSEVTGRRGLWCWTHTKLSCVCDGGPQSLEVFGVRGPTAGSWRPWRPALEAHISRHSASVIKHILLTAVFLLRSILIGCEGTGEVLLLSCRGWCWDEDVSKKFLAEIETICYSFLLALFFM